MPTIKEGISAISEELNDMIQKEIQGILNDAEKEKRAIIEESNRKAEIKIEELKTESDKIIRREKRRTESLITLETRRNVARFKDKVIKEAFIRIENKLKEYAKSNQYLDTLHNYITQGIEELVNLIKKQDENSNISLVIRVNKSDMEKIPNDWLKDFETRFNIQIKLASPIQIIGGSKIETEDGSISYDNTFEGRLKRKKTQIRMKLASILFPEERQ
ncbi:MAG: V-type ATP synthase subunit E [Candidatus Helarchaeota archaeon]